MDKDDCKDLMISFLRERNVNVMAQCSEERLESREIAKGTASFIVSDICSALSFAGCRC